jgi:peptidoglycan/xylan/chitin deacetylase (PgdA/CDA1 family)
VSKLVCSGVEAELLLVGDGSEFGALQAMAESLGVGERVHALGHRSDVFDVLAAADCFAMLSSTEGLPFAPLEATVLGLPLVLTRVGELPALIGEDAARFVPVGDRDAAAQALAELAGSATLRSTLGAIAATRASAALTADEFLPAMMAVYGTTEASRPLRSAAAALASSSLCRRTAHASARFSQRVLAAGSTLSVLTYHRVAEVGGAHLDPTLLSATPEEFDEQMRMLRSRFQPVDVHAVIAAIVGEQQLPPNAVHVSFDDGYRDVQRHAVPILERYGIPATLFVPTNYPDHPELDFWWDRLYRALAAAANRVCVTPAGTFVLDGRPAAAEAASRSIARYVKTLAHADAMDVVDDIVTSLGGTEPLNEVLGWDELAALSSAGVTIASHSRSHAALDGLPVEALDDELTGSRSDIERHLGSCPALFAYPTGQSSAAVRTQVRTAGYVAAFGTEAGINRLPVEDPLQLRRIDVGRRVDARLLEVLLSPLGRPLDRIR